MSTEGIVNSSFRVKDRKVLAELKRAQQIRKQIDTLVETAEKWKPYKKPKKEKRTKLVPSKRLDTWIKR